MPESKLVTSTAQVHMAASGFFTPAKCAIFSICPRLTIDESFATPLHLQPPLDHKSLPVVNLAIDVFDPDCTELRRERRTHIAAVAGDQAPREQVIAIALL